METLRRKHFIRIILATTTVWTELMTAKFPDSNFMTLDSLEESKNEWHDIVYMIARVSGHFVLETHWEALKNFFTELTNSCRTHFPAAAFKINPLCIHLKPNASLIHFKQQNYSPKPHLFIKNVLYELLGYEWYNQILCPHGRLRQSFFFNWLQPSGTHRRRNVDQRINYFSISYSADDTWAAESSYITLLYCFGLHRLFFAACSPRKLPEKGSRSYYEMIRLHHAGYSIALQVLCLTSNHFSCIVFHPCSVAAFNCGLISFPSRANPKALSTISSRFCSQPLIKRPLQSPKGQNFRFRSQWGRLSTTLNFCYNRPLNLAGLTCTDHRGGEE